MAAMSVPPAEYAEIAWVPALLQRRLAATNGPLSEPAWEELRGAILFADIHGFTALADRMARQTNAGAERLTQILNQTFGELVSIVIEHGGDVVSFAGDAMLAVWPDDDGDLGRAVRLAAQCGLAIQERVNDRETVDGLRVALRLAIGAGDLRAVWLGGLNGRWTFAVVGEPLAQIVQIAADAEPGRVVLSTAAWRLVSDFAEGDVRVTWARLTRLTARVALRRLARPPLADSALHALRGFLPSPVLASIELGEGAWVAELRRVTVVFVNLPDLDHTTGLTQAQALLRKLQEVLFRYEGSIDKLSVDDKGISLVAAFGLPPLAHEDDPGRAVRAAIRIQQHLRELGVRVAIGITTGRAYCGAVGGEERREYTMIGDVVNVAARLMQSAAAAGGILVDGATAQGDDHRCDFTALPPLTLKGKSAPIEVFRPDPDSRTSGENRILGPIVGRDVERALLAERLRALQDGDGSVLLIEGEAGIGKSRLVFEALELAAQSGIPALIGSGDAIERSTPYFAWRAPFGQLLGAEGRRDLAAVRHEINLTLEAWPEVARRAPLLNAVVPIDLPENDLTQHMAGQVRADNTHALLVHILQQRVANEPLLVVIEDVHWLDAASWELLRVLSRDVTRVMFLLAGRPLEGPRPIALSANVTRVVLEAMGAKDVLELVSRRLGVDRLPEPLARLIREKAEGHPFFSEELAYALRDAGLIDVVDGECRLRSGGGDLLDLSFGNTLEGVITSRIDRLPAPVQLTLKTASVVGRVFPVRILQEVHPLAATAGELDDQLALLERLDITPLETPEPSRAYVFKHIITQQVTYNLMLYAQRQQLHRAVAEWYERVHADDLSPYHPLLAYHWGKADVPERALHHLEKSGEQALRSYANRDAASFLTEAIALAERHGGIPAQRVATWERQLGEAKFCLGEMEECRQHLERALVLLGHGLPTSPLGQALGLVRQLFWQVLHRWLPDSFLGRGADRREALLEAARASERLTEVHYFANQKLPSFYAVMQALNLAEAVGPSPELVRAYSSMCLGMGVVKQHGMAIAHRERALAADRELADPNSHTWMLGLLGTYALGVGDWVEGRERFTEAIAANRQIGDWTRWANCVLPRAWIMLSQGELGPAAREFDAVVTAERRYDQVVLHAIALGGQAVLSLRFGRAGDAERALVLCDQGFRVLGGKRDRAAEILLHGTAALAASRTGEVERMRVAVDAGIALVHKTDPIGSYLVEGYAGLAEAAVRDFLAAPEREQASDQATAAFQAFGDPFPIGAPRAKLFRGLHERQRGNDRKAVRLWRAGLEVARRLGMPFDEALLREALGEADAAERLFVDLGTAWHLDRLRGEGLA